MRKRFPEFGQTMRFLVKAISGQPLLHVILENAERAEGRIFVAAYDEFSILKDRDIGLSLLTSLISEPRPARDCCVTRCMVGLQVARGFDDF
jgi:hypothetical protein